MSRKKITLTPIVKSLKGSFTAPDDFHFKNMLIESLTEKYLPVKSDSEPDIKSQNVPTALRCENPGVNRKKNLEQDAEN